MTEQQYLYMTKTALLMKHAAGPTTGKSLLYSNTPVAFDNTEDEATHEAVKKFTAPAMGTLVGHVSPPVAEYMRKMPRNQDELKSYGTQPKKEAIGWRKTFNDLIGTAASAIVEGLSEPIDTSAPDIHDRQGVSTWSRPK